jgi:hypothetical protein
VRRFEAAQEPRYVEERHDVGAEAVPSIDAVREAQIEHVARGIEDLLEFELEGCAETGLVEQRRRDLSEGAVHPLDLARSTCATWSQP